MITCSKERFVRPQDPKPLGDLGGPWRSWVRHESDALPSEMKGVHPEQKSSKTGSEAPCVAPRGVRQRRSQDALGRKPRAAKLRAVARSKPSSSLVTRSEEAEPLQAWRRQHASGSSSTSAPRYSSGVAGTARSERKALNVRDLEQLEANETDGTRRRAEAARLVEESEKPVVPVKAAKAVGGKGLRLGTRLER